MYEVDERDRVVELAGVPQSCTGAPLPLVLADEHALLLAYLANVPDPNWDGSYVHVVGPETEGRTVAVVEFEFATAHLFGPPNDEAFGGHPLARRGLCPYGAFEVVDSSWIRKQERMNAIHPRHDRALFLENRRHFVFTFHDSTFECIARDYAIEVRRGTLSNGLDWMRDRMVRRWARY